jgi:multidrug resistance protein MdtO
VRWEWEFLGFLRNELAASPARWRATLRTTLAVMITVVLIMALDVPEGEFLLVTLFVCAPIDAGASIDKARLRMFGTLAGGAIGTLTALLSLDKPWLFLPIQALVMGLAMFFARTTTAPYAFILGAITVVMVVPLYPTSPAASLEIALWRTGLTTLGVLIAIASQLLFWPDDPEVLLLDSVTGRVRDTETLLARVATLRPGDHLSATEEGIAVTGVSAQLDLLKSAETKSRWLRQRHAEQIALITRVQILVTAARRLVRFATLAPIPQWAPARVDRARRGCEEVRRALSARRPVERILATEPPRAAPSSFEIEAAAALEELERVLALLPDATRFLADWQVTAPGPAGEPLAEQRLLTPACTPRNGDAIRFALKVALATTLCGVFLEATNLPGLATALITCPVIAQSFVGAGLRRATLRLAGALAGTVIALVVIVGLMPAMETIASYLVVASIAFGLAAWVVSGSSRISYVGLQIAILLALTIVQSRAPTTDLAPAADRILGVLLGIVVMGMVDVTLWPVFGDTALRRMLADALRQMAELYRVAAAGDLAGMRQLALGVYRTLGDALAMHDDLAFEPGVGHAAAVHGALLRLASGVERLFLDLVTLGRHRAAPVPAGVEADLPRLDADITAAIAALAQRLLEGGGVSAPLPMPQLGALRSAEELRGCARLYDVVFAALHELADDVAVLERAVTPLTEEPVGPASPPRRQPRTPAPQPS